MKARCKVLGSLRRLGTWTSGGDDSSAKDAVETRRGGGKRKERRERARFTPRRRRRRRPRLKAVDIGDGWGNAKKKRRRCLSPLSDRPTDHSREGDGETDGITLVQPARHHSAAAAATGVNDYLARLEVAASLSLSLALPPHDPLARHGAAALS